MGTEDQGASGQQAETPIPISIPPLLHQLVQQPRILTDSQISLGMRDGNNLQMSQLTAKQRQVLPVGLQMRLWFFEGKHFSEEDHIGSLLPKPYTTRENLKSTLQGGSTKHQETAIAGHSVDFDYHYDVSLLSDEVKKQLLAQQGGRSISHLARLLVHEQFGAQAEGNFARAFMDTYPSFIKRLRTEANRTLDDSISRRFSDVWEGEGSDTFAIWTFAPYVLQTLEQRGISTKDAMKRIFQWALTHRTPDDINLILRDVRKQNPNLSREEQMNIVYGFYLTGLTEVNQYFAAGSHDTMLTLAVTPPNATEKGATHIAAAI